jgi:hypothetical protein
MLLYKKQEWRLRYFHKTNGDYMELRPQSMIAVRASIEVLAPFAFSAIGTDSLSRDYTINELQGRMIWISSNC